MSRTFIITVTSNKGGVAKTTTALHLAAYCQRKGPTLVIDSDPNRTASRWAKRGSPAFRVAPEATAARYVKDAEYIVIDTPGRPDRESMEAVVEGCDFLVLPTTPDAYSLEALMDTVKTLRELSAETGRAPSWRVLLTMVPPAPRRDGQLAREALEAEGLPLFGTEIPDLSAFVKSAAMGVPVSEVAGDRRAERAWAAYEAVAKEILP